LRIVSCSARTLKLSKFRVNISDRLIYLLNKLTLRSDLTLTRTTRQTSMMRVESCWVTNSCTSRGRTFGFAWKNNLILLINKHIVNFAYFINYSAWLVPFSNDMIFKNIKFLKTNFLIKELNTFALNNASRAIKRLNSNNSAVIMIK